MKRILLIVGLFILACNSVNADDYVSPENYAVNESDLYESYKSYTMPQNQYVSEPIKNAVSTGRTDNSLFCTMDEAIKSRLRKIRYGMQESHHGQLHEIKLNSTYKLKQRGLLYDEPSVAEDGDTTVENIKPQSKKELKNEKKNLEKIQRFAEKQTKKESKTKLVQFEKTEKVKAEKVERIKKVKVEKNKKTNIENPFKDKKVKQIQPIVEPMTPETPVYDYAETGSTTYDDIYTGIGTNFSL